MHIYLICRPLQAARKGSKVKLVDCYLTNTTTSVPLKVLQYSTIVHVYEWMGKAEVGTDCLYAAHTCPSSSPYRIIVFLPAVATNV